MHREFPFFYRWWDESVPTKRRDQAVIVVLVMSFHERLLQMRTYVWYNGMGIYVPVEGGGTLIRVLKTAFRVNQEDRNRLFMCNRISAQIWNDCLEVAKQYASWRVDRENGTAESLQGEISDP